MAHTSLASLFSDIADAIRGKTGSSAQIVADNFPTAIAGIEARKIGTATTTIGSSNTAEISFNVSGNPVAFALQFENSSYVNASSTRTVASVIFDGSNYGHTMTRNGYLYFYSGQVSTAYSNGVLTATISNSSTNGLFRSSATYLLIYVY